MVADLKTPPQGQCVDTRTALRKCALVALALSSAGSVSGCAEIILAPIILPAALIHESNRGFKSITRDPGVTATPSATGYAPTGKHEPVLKHAGTVASGDLLPAGELYVLDEFWLDSDNDVRGRLIVKFGSTTPKGERSYSAQTKVQCAKGTLSILRSGTYSIRDSTGLLSFSDAANGQVTFEEHAPPLRIDDPTPAVKSAIAAFCRTTT